MRPARRLPNGLWRPWAADLLERLREQARLREQGLELDLDHGELAALGQVTADARDGLDHAMGQQYWNAEPELSPKARRILDQIVAEREAARPPLGVGQVHGQPMRMDHGQTAPDRSLGGKSNFSILSDSGRVDPGRAGTVARQQQQNRGKVEKNNPLGESADDEQFEED